MHDEDDGEVEEGKMRREVISNALCTLTMTRFQWCQFGCKCVSMIFGGHEVIPFVVTTSTQVEGVRVLAASVSAKLDVDIHIRF